MGRSIINISPTKFRASLVSVMILMLALGIFGFYTVQTTLSSRADEVRATVTEAEASKDSVAQLQRLESELKRLADARVRAGSIIADSQSYQYQNQIIADLNHYASQSGVTISQFNFLAEASPAAAPAATPAPASGGPGPTTATPTPGSPGASAGLRSTTVSVTLSPPIRYTNLLNFVRSVEKSLTKMQISGVSLTPGDGVDTISTDALNIEVYIK